MIQRIGILGYGRFGRALAALLRQRGASVLAFDTAAPRSPAGSAAAELCPSPETLAAASDVIVLATPVDVIPAALQGLRPSLGRNHLVLDVGSVKLRPIAAMDRILGDEIPWVGTHPLFGPLSLALGERPLRWVVCPNQRHPAAVTAAKRLLAAIGCTVLERDPAAHDRTMAQTHALAYFIAKAVLEAGLELDVDIAPPSARAIARTVESTRADAGHLLTTLHRENPFAADVRARFLAALTEVDRRLESPAGRPAAGGADPPFEIPDLGAGSPELKATREIIDDLDAELLTLLARRTALAQRAGAAKSALGRPVLDPQRERALLAGRRTRAEGLGLDPDDVAAVFEAILRLSRRAQDEAD